MQAEFQDMSQFFNAPPCFEEMVFESKDTRRKKNDVLIIVPSYHDNFRLGKLLTYLKRQDFKGFDVAIILAKDDKFVSSAGLSLYQIRRNMDFGFAGSVYLGQLFALREKYKYYIFTDVDRVPHTASVIGEFYCEAEKSGADYVFGNNLVKGYFFRSEEFFDFKNPLEIPSNCVFSLIRTDTILKTGLYALPLYIGHEDVEFEYRLRKAMRFPVHINKPAYESYNSPAKNPFLKNFGGNDMGYLYIYPTMLGIYNFPQASNHLGFFREFRVFFIMLLAQKFSALRVPALADFEKSAKKCRFARTSCKGVSSEISKRQVKKEEGEDYENYTPNAFSANVSFISRAILSHVKNRRMTNYSPMFEFFLSDSFYVYDEAERKAFMFEWKRIPGAATKIIATSSALFEALFASFRAQLSGVLGDQGIFAKYGIPSSK